jgi:hypothetical protein
MTQGYIRGATQARSDWKGIAAIATVDEMVAGTDQEKMATPLGVAEAITKRAGITGVETGTWTPAFTFETPGNLSVAYTTQSGYYTRIGDLVYIAARLVFTPTYTTASGFANVANFPFPVNSSTTQSLLECQFGTTAATFPAGVTQLNLQLRPPVPTTARFLGGGTGITQIALGTAAFPTATAREVYFSGCYKAATSAGQSGTYITAVTQGVFTPTFTFATPGTLSVVYTSQVGSYVRVGNLVFVTIRCAFTPTLGTASGAWGSIRSAPCW